MKRESIDFHLVAERHLAIHARLLNWARWCNNRTGSAVTPMFRHYRSTEVCAEHAVMEPVDTMDAEKIEKAVTALPEKHKAAAQWHYVRGYISPIREARTLAVSLAGLAELVHDARTMLVNRKA